MKKLTTSHKSFSLLLGLSLLTAVPSWSQDAKLEIEQRPLAELPNSISVGETVQSRMEKFILEQGLQDVKNNQKDETGRIVLIEFATASISAYPSDPNFVSSRINAFAKALERAKIQCAEFQKNIVSTEAVLDTGLPSSARATADAEQLKREGMTQEGATKVAQALNADLKGRANMPQAIQTAALYGEKILGNKMSEEIRKKGLDPSKPVDEQVAKTIAESESFKNAVSTVASARCTGIKIIASFEQNPSSGQGSIGIVTVWTEKLHAIADAIVTNHWELIQRGEPGKTIAEHVPNDVRTLLTTYGAQLVRDEKGDYVVMAYAQAQPRTKNQQSINSAYEVAKTRGIGLIRSFMGEALETNRELLDAEVSTVFTDSSTRYQEDSSFAQKSKSIGMALPISGISVAHQWETRHPANDGPVVGMVVKWKVDSAKIAAMLLGLNQASGAKAAEVSRGLNGGNSSGGASASQGGGSVPASKPNKSEAYQGQGKASRDF
jgi:hypothetical protein